MNNTIKILLVEDHPIAQMAGKLSLQRANYTVDIASSGKLALEMSLTKQYDVIFMDIGLEEGTNGFEVTQQIKAQSELNKSTPVIALTAHGDSLYREKAREVGMTDFLTKPLETEHAVKIINALVLHACV